MHNLLAGWRVLVVEDEMMILMMLEMALEDFGYESIVVASTLDTAMEMVSRPGFDIAMLDMNLGGNDSYPIADALDARNVPYVFCTGNNGGDRRKGVPLRPTLRKPFGIDEMAKALALLIAEVKNPRAAASAPTRDKAERFPL
jgi:DNA-binding response OmpR family regulator